jgi:hypothetical protein
MRLAIIQSAYVPWKGFFDLIGRCDAYVVFDSAQYVKRHWHNRNIIKTASGPQWLTIPVVTKGRFDQPIHDVEIEKPWADKHWRALESAYGKAPCFDAVAPQVRGLYDAADRATTLSLVNAIFLTGICEMLGITTRISDDRQYPADGRKTERLVAIAKQAGATAYLSGPSARDYLEESQFAAAGIAVEWMAYEGYPRYPQLHGGFDDHVSILDVLFHTGPDAPRHVFTFRPA